jgi:hypothetical protein
MTDRPSRLLSQIALVVVIGFSASISTAGQIWTVLGAKPKGTARDSSLAEAAQLSYRYDKAQDVLWFRVSLYGALNEQAFGLNLVFDTGGDEAAKMNWWGANKTFKFDRLVNGVGDPHR